MKLKASLVALAILCPLLTHALDPEEKGLSFISLSDDLGRRTIPAEEKIISGPTFQPIPVTGAALEKEKARLCGLLEKAKQKQPQEGERPDRLR